ncbi:cell division protein FtsZ [Prosthecomicrobium sp. N25]|uniref:cell division protein FtsZ n=1 Tax=Prosthecomicrobium sp. N25 TaxID=3129254 RepID=UPI003077A392
MTLNLKLPDIRELRPRITVFGVGGAGGNAVNNMITTGLHGVDFVVANTDAQALTLTKSDRVIQMGVAVTEGLGAGSQPEVGRAAAEEVIDEIADHLSGAHMVFITAGMGGGTGTGAAPVVARAAREQGILTVGVVTKPFHFEGARRMRVAEQGIAELQKSVDTLIVIPNQNLFRIANERTTFADAFAMADQVLYSGVACITDLMVKEGLINLDFADVRSIMRGMGKAMMGTGEASGDKRALQAAEAAIANPLLDETSMKGARGVLISISGGKDLTLYEVDEAATRIREEVDPDANIILGATFDDSLEGVVRVSVVATGIDQEPGEGLATIEYRQPEQPVRPRTPVARQAAPASIPAPQPQPQPAFAAPAPRYDEPAPLQRRDLAHAAALQAEAEARIEREIAIPEPPTQPIAVAEDPAVTIQRHSPAPAAYETPDPIHDLDEPHPMRHEPEVSRDPYIPPAAAQPSQPRMPRYEDLPRPGKALAAAAGHAGVDPHGDDGRRPMSLLKRLANGFSRQQEDEVPTQASAPQPREPGFAPAPAQDFARRPPVRPQAPEAPPRAPQGHLDPHGRMPQASVEPQPRAARVGDEDHLEIPAFLRRQAN